MTGRTQDTAVSSRRHIAARPRIGFLHRAGCENPLFLYQDRAGGIS
jgi:hypothetical protein